jgi:flagellar hook-associated protein 2
MSATSTADAVATASATTSALAGSLSFTVGSLAVAGGKASSGTVSTTSAVISSGIVLLATGTSSIGVSSVKAGVGLTAGEHEIEVTQQGSAAVKSGDAAIVGSVVIGAGNDTLNLTVNGNATPITLDHGSWNTAQLAAQITSKSGGTVVASDEGGTLVLRSAAHGSNASISVGGGNANNDLELSVGAGTAGTDGIVEVNGIVNTLNLFTPGGSVNVNSDVGVLRLDIAAGGLVLGSVTTTAISTGAGTLAETAAAINAAKKGISAAVVQVAPSTFKLQLSATTTGLANDISIANDAFTGIGNLASTSVASDASITVGSGAGQYSVTSATNTVSSLLPGVTLTVKTTGAATVTVARDTKSVADSVSAMVGFANASLAEIQKLTAVNTTTGTGSVLTGSFALRTLQTRIITAVVDAVETSTLGSAGAAGLSTTKTGTLTFDRAKFEAAFVANADQVAALFKAGGTATSPKVEFHSSTNATQVGDYDVVINVAAERAEVVGNVVAGGVIAANETIELRVGGATGTTVSYAATAGETLASIADELNQLLAAENLDVAVTVEGGALAVRTTGYGEGSKFEVQTSLLGANQSGLALVAATWEEHIGVDVDGTINGVVATGSGQLLIAPPDDDELAGLTLKITATAADVLLSTNFGSFGYRPGVAKRLAMVSHSAVDTVSGTLTSLIEGRETEIERLNDRIDRWDVQLARREATLRRQFTAMEVALQRMQGQSQWLAGQIASMQANSAAGR